MTWQCLWKKLNFDILFTHKNIHKEITEMYSENGTQKYNFLGGFEFEKDF